MGNIQSLSTLRTVLYIILALCLAACRQSQQITPPGASAIGIELETAPEPPTTGDTTLLVTLKDANGQPIRDARLEVRGDMTHAGMQPVTAITDEDPADGVYRVPFQWTMSGDWIVTVSVILPNGETHKKTFDFTVDD